MAKISTYPSVSSPSLSDMLIGTDVVDNNATKNFSVQSLLSLFNDPSVLTGFVPYTGATQNLDLGSYGVTADFGDFQNLMVNGSDIFAYGQFYSSSIQQAVLSNTPSQVEFENTVLGQNVSVDPNNDLFVSEEGIYMINLNARVEHTSGGGDAQLSFWLSKSGSNIPFSRQVFTVANQHVQEICYTFLIRISPNENLSIFWTTSNTNATLSPTASATFYPEAASTMIHIYKVAP